LSQKIPQHVAIVMDGNGRWAENQGLERIEGHRAGLDVVRMVIKFCLHKNIPVLSLFAFSSENWSRPTAEVEFLMQIFLESLKQEKSELHDKGICIRFMGDRSKLSDDICNKMYEAETLTINNNNLILNIALNYGGKWDIIQATKKIIKEVVDKVIALEDIDETTFSQRLSSHGLPDPDLFIRTSGEKRISNFFLMQLAYTELYFSDLYWPDFSVDEFENILSWFSERNRRYGNIERKHV